MFQKTEAWNAVETFHKKLCACTEEGEWVGAYLNLQLAVLSCKQYVDMTGAAAADDGALSDGDQGARTAVTPRSLSSDAPVRSLQTLLALLPRYKAMLKRFQQHFGCPPAADEKSKDAFEVECAEHKPIDIVAESLSNKAADVVRFDSIVGNDVAKDSIRSSIIYPFTLPNLFPKLTGGILFYGPAGTGKTMLAKATAFELCQNQSDRVHVLYYAPTADNLKGKYLGETEKKITSLFDCASRAAREAERRLKKAAIAILFIDEIDSIARRRDSGSDASGVNASSTNTLLQMMDGVQSHANVLVLSATNLPWELDSAVLRRFNSQIYVKLPTDNDVEALLKRKIAQWITRVIFDPILKLHDRVAARPHVQRGNALWYAGAVSKLDTESGRVRRVRVTFDASDGDEWYSAEEIALDWVKKNDPTICSGFDWDEAFDLLRWLHTIKATELTRVATEMCQNRFASRDITNICKQVFRAQAAHARQDSGFYEVELNKDNEIDTPHCELQNRRSVCAALQGKYVSHETYLGIAKRMPNILTKQTAVYPTRVKFPLQVQINKKTFKHHSTFRNLPLNVATHMPANLRMYFLHNERDERDERDEHEDDEHEDDEHEDDEHDEHDEHDEQGTTFMLHRQFVTTNKEVATHTDVLLRGVSPYEDDEDEDANSVEKLLKQKLLKKITHMYIHYKRASWYVIKIGELANGKRTIKPEPFIDSKPNTVYKLSEAADVNAVDQFVSYLATQPVLAAGQVTARITVQYTTRASDPDAEKSAAVQRKCCNFVLHVSRFKEAMKTFPTTDKSTIDGLDYYNLRRRPPPDSMNQGE
jgi:DNA polymerase III delta prime subunit